MLDLAADHLTYRHDKRSPAAAIDDVSVLVAKSTYTAVAGASGCGATTLLALLAGALRPDGGTIRIGARDVTGDRAARRPVLYVTATPDVPDRWSVQHALVAAVRQRSIDREDRHHEYEMAVTKWRVGTLLERRLGSLSGSERTFVHLARIELLKPAILIADRLLEHLGAAELPEAADELHRTLRVLGTTVISAPAASLETGFADRLLVLDRGRIIQEGAPSEIYRHPASEAAARATGEINVVPVTVRAGQVESPIGAWNLGQPPFEGSGVALARPEDFAIAAPGEESDLILGIEEASFHGGRWHIRGLLSGNLTLRVSLPPTASVHKGRLLPLRYDPTAFQLLSRPEEPPVTIIPTGTIPLMRDSR